MAGRPRTRARLAAEANSQPDPRLDRNGHPIKGAAGRKPSPELLAKMAEGRRRAYAAKREEKEAAKPPSKMEAREQAMRVLWPKAYQVMEMALDGAIDRGVADRDAINAAFKLFEQKFGKATQTLAMDKEKPIKVIYEAAFFHPDFLSEN